jgi:hypothetical protein
MYLLKYHATGFGSELPTWQFDGAKLGMGSKKNILRWLLVVVRYLKSFGIICGCSTLSCHFSTAGGIFQTVSREKLPYLDATW